jgi:hypothetical protein
MVQECGDKKAVMEFDNLIDQSFNIDFCNHLEYHLSRTFKQSSNPELISFWCDGIILPEFSDALTKIIKTEKKIVTQAWLGNNGQDKYSMKIFFGECSMNNLNNGFSLIDCLPSELIFDWVMVDIENYKIEIQLK